MTGSSMAPIMIAIVASLSLAVWIVMVMYADRHPMHGHGPPSGPPPPGLRTGPGIPRQVSSEAPGPPGAEVPRQPGPPVPEASRAEDAAADRS